VPNFFVAFCEDDCAEAGENASKATQMENARGKIFKFFIALQGKGLTIEEN
jgi:hypothetical protein